MTTTNAIQFTGTGDSCTEVTAFLGGSYAAITHQWKSCTNDGGYVFSAEGTQEFNPGDWIVRGEDGGFSVHHRRGGHTDQRQLTRKDPLTAKVRPEAHAAVQGVEPVDFYSETKVDLTDADLADLAERFANP